MATLAVAGLLSTASATTAATTTFAVGAALATSVAGVIDSVWIGALTATEQQAPKYGGQGLTYASEGDPLARCWGGTPDGEFGIPGWGGDSIRMGTSLLWASEPYFDDTRPPGGLLGKRGGAVQRSWFRDVQIAVCANPFETTGLISNAEALYRDTPNIAVTVPVNSTNGVAEFFLDYTSQFNARREGNSYFFTWTLIIRHSVSGGTPSTSNTRLTQFRTGERVFLDLADPGGAQESRRFVTGNSPRVPYRVRETRDNIDGTTELHLELSGQSDNVWISDEIAITLGNVVGPFQAIPPLPTEARGQPIRTTVATPVDLTITSDREPWAENVLMNPNPVEGVDFEFHSATNPGVQSQIVRTSFRGGLGDAAPYHAGISWIALKGLNVTARGNILASIEAIGIEGALCPSAAIATDLISLADVPPSRIQWQRGTGVRSLLRPVDSIAYQRVVTAANIVPDSQASRGSTEILLDTGFSTAPFGISTMFTLLGATLSETERADEGVTLYRVREVVQNTANPNQWRVRFHPPLANDEYGKTLRVYDTTAFSNVEENTDGFFIEGLSDTEGALGPVMISGDLEVREGNGALTLFPATERQTVTVKVADLDARDSGSNRGDAIRIDDRESRAKPQRIEVTFRNRLNNSQAGSEEASTDATNDGLVGAGIPDAQLAPHQRGVVQRINLDTVAITRRHGNIIANRSKRRADERKPAGITLPRKYRHIQPGDLIEFDEPIDDQRYVILADSVQWRANRTVNIEGFVVSSTFERSIAGSSAAADPRQGQRLRLPSYASPDLEVLDIPPVTDEMIGRLGIGVVVDLPTEAASTASAGLWSAFDDSDVWDPVATVLPTPVLGRVDISESTVDATPNPQLIDWTTRIRVRMARGTLASTTEPLAAGGANGFLWGSEVCSFVTATLEADGSYTLSGILRGRAGTAIHMATHNADERFVFLGSPSVPTSMEWMTLSLPDIGRVAKVRATAPGQAPEDGTLDVERVAMHAARPFPVRDIGWRRTADGTLTLGWSRVPRQQWNPLSGIAAPRHEPDEMYAVQFWDVNDVPDPWATFEVDGTEFTITQYTQNARAIPDVDQIRVRIWRRSSLLDGEPREILVNGANLGVGAGASDW